MMAAPNLLGIPGLREVDLVWFSTAGAPEKRRLAIEESFIIGRGEACQVRLKSEFVSRQHAVVTLNHHSMQVRDLSSNGTMAGTTMLRGQALDVPYRTPIVVGEYTIIVKPTLPDDPSAAEAPPSAAPSSAPSSVDRDIRREIHRQLLDYLDLAKLDSGKLDDPSLRPKVLLALRRIIASLDGRIPEQVNRDVLLGELADEALGLGPLERFLADPSVDEIMVVDANTIYVEIAGKVVKSDVCFTDDERVRAVIERIVTPLGRRIDESSPLVDARLKDGSRVNAIIKPLAIKGSCITIRKFARSPLQLSDLISFGALTSRMALFLTRSVIARKNIVVSGGTGSGKTTLLNVLSAAVPERERIVTIEDAAELKLEQPHVVSLETRPANMEGQGQFSIRDLVKNALRMRPDRIVVGECRGGEALDMLQAMNTGHDGSLTTTHANSTLEALGRLETLCLMSGVELPARAIREQIATSIDLVVQQTRFSDGGRKITEIAEVSGLGDDGEFVVHPLFRFIREGQDARGTVCGTHRATGYLPSFLDQFIVMGLIKPGEAYL
ncbi:MAG TPA: ATPase, T2SS/T4P/T4SS family [Polyangiaceae bacterium]|jgi:pilus assembly protein CpaF|nr:ATPase, T2SS/T4P/T4SS family [Polyangiaceae bacterium]